MATNSAYHKPESIRPMVAGGTITQYTIVVIGSAEDTVISGANIRDTQIIGIALNGASSGEAVDVATGGHCLCKVDGNAAAIAVGDAIMVHDSAGYGQKVATGGAGLVECIGFANNASTADGDLISVRISKHQVYFAA